MTRRSEPPQPYAARTEVSAEKSQQAENRRLRRFERLADGANEGLPLEEE